MELNFGIFVIIIIIICIIPVLFSIIYEHMIPTKLDNTSSSLLAVTVVFALIIIFTATSNYDAELKDTSRFNKSFITYVAILFLLFMLGILS